jgi:hypothetical protein
MPAFFGAVLVVASAAAGELHKPNTEVLRPDGITAAANPTEADHGALLEALREQYRDMLDRPLFSPSRRPTVRTVAKAAAGPLPVLKGVAILDRRRMAVVDYGSPVQTRVVTEGQAIEAGTVEKILQDRIVVRALDGAEAEILLHPGNAPNESDPVPGSAPNGTLSRSHFPDASAGARGGAAMHSGSRPERVPVAAGKAGRG